MKLVSEKEVMDAIKLLGWKDISTKKQQRNGTIIYRLPIKMYGQYIEVGSFQSGYVRRMNGGYTPYQLNKCESSVEYFKDYEWVTKNDGNGDYGKQEWTGKYRKFTTRGCELIPNEVDRLEYLVEYCLKNYYIKQANQVEDGKFVPKWVYDEAYKKGYDDGSHDWSQSPEVKVIVNGHKYNVT